MCLGLGCHSTEVYEESILFCRVGWGVERDTRAPLELIFMFPQSSAAEAPKDQVMIQVVPGIQDKHVPKETTIRI